MPPSAKLPCPWKALWRHASCSSSITDPLEQFVFAPCVQAIGRVSPGEAIDKRERLDVAYTAVAVALQPDALATRHFCDLFDGENEHLPVLADDRNRVALQGDAETRFVRHLYVHHLLALAGIGKHVLFRDDEAVAGMGNEQQLALRVIGKCSDDFLVSIHVDHDAHRLAMPAPARQLVSAKRQELAAGRKDQDLVRGLRMEGQ